MKDENCPFCWEAGEHEPCEATNVIWQVSDNALSIQ